MVSYPLIGCCKSLEGWTKEKSIHIQIFEYGNNWRKGQNVELIWITIVHSGEIRAIMFDSYWDFFWFALGIPASDVKRRASKGYPAGANRYPYNTGLNCFGCCFAVGIGSRMADVKNMSISGELSFDGRSTGSFHISWECEVRGFSYFWVTLPINTSLQRNLHVSVSWWMVLLRGVRTGSKVPLFFFNDKEKAWCNTSINYESTVFIQLIRTVHILYIPRGGFSTVLDLMQ